MERLILASPMQAFPANCSKMYRAWQLRTLYRRLVSNANTIIEGNKRTWWSQVTPPLKGISEFLIVARVIHTSRSSQPRIGTGLKNRISVVFENLENSSTRYTDHRPAEGFLPSYEIPLKIQRDEPLVSADVMSRDWTFCRWRTRGAQINPQYRVH